MAGLLQSLVDGSRALSVHSKGLEVAGKNLANISNPAYARQRVKIGDLGQIATPQGTMSMGVQVLAVQQVRNQLLDRQVVREISIGNGFSGSLDVLRSAESALGQKIDRSLDSTSVGNTTDSTGGGISETLNDFFKTWERISARPNDVGEKQLLIEKAELLAEKINLADERLQTVQNDATAQIEVNVAKANDILQSIADINLKIGRAENGAPDTAIDLRDQRQEKLEELAEFLNFDYTTVPGSNGQIQITVKNSGGSDVVLLNQNTVNGPLTFDGTNFQGGSPVVTFGFSSGSLVGMRDARDGMVQTTRDMLDSLSQQLTASVNAAYNPTNIVGGNFFDTTPTGLISVDPNLTVSNLRTTNTGNVGANELALAVSQLANQQFSIAGGDLIDGTPSQYFASIAATLGQSINSATARYEDQQLSMEFVRASRDASSGVSQDEELTDLMKFQRAFQASGRYVNILDQLLDQVVNRLGAS